MSKPEKPELDFVRRFVVDGWLRDQQHWHARTADRREGSHRLARRFVVTLFGATFAMAALHLAGVGVSPDAPPIASLDAWLAYLAIILPAWGAGIHAIDKSIENERVAAIEELQVIVREAVFVVGLENYEWSVLLSFDPPELAA
jgi:hypothetical protein